MELFEFDDALLLSPIIKKPDFERERITNPRSGQQSLLLNAIEASARSRLQVRTPKSRDPLQFSKYDEKLGQHLKKHNGLTQSFRDTWSKVGSLESASKRIKSLQKKGLLDRNGLPTPIFEKELGKYKEKICTRGLVRGRLIQQERSKLARQMTANLTVEQKNLISNLAEFRQVTYKQSQKSKLTDDKLAYLKEQGIIESRKVVIDQKPITLLTLTQRNKGKCTSGQDIAQYGLGIQKPFIGIQRDHSKLLHDVSVIDAMAHAKDKFLKKGYSFVGAVSEHRLYGEKTNPNSDLGQRYADAYMIFKDSSGDSVNVAVEFGNYAPGYLKDKLQGIQADQILVYTHEENRAQEYAKIITQNTEVIVIPTPNFQEIDR